MPLPPVYQEKGIPKECRSLERSQEFFNKTSYSHWLDSITTISL